MRRALSLLGVAVLVGLAAASIRCTSSAARCNRDVTCYDGLCLAPPTGTVRYCAYGDPRCATGWRWAPSADHGLGDTCVETAPDLGEASDGGTD